MDERWDRVEALFHEALERDPETREAWLETRIPDDDALRGEVRELLAAHEDSDTRLDAAVSELTSDLVDPAKQSGNSVGPFTLGKVIASGGMGTVYEARQEAPRRQVALKILRRGFAGPDAVRRFEYESQVLAHLRHPGIAHVYESGTLDDEGGERPWFAMELVEGARPLTTHASERKLDLDARLRLVIEVCDAVQHGHQRGVVHRDLKPANVLVDTQGKAKIIDFGVAKATGDAGELSPLETAGDQVIGTPRYMSPEQAAGSDTPIDTRADVYALGVISYELVSGSMPYALDGVGVLDALQVIRDASPRKGPLAQAEVPDDLCLILFKALEKEPDRRYESAAAFADDLRRFLAHEPVSARPPSTVYQLRKFARRNRVLVASATLVSASLVLGIAGTTWGLLEAQRQREEAEIQRIEAERARDEALWGQSFLTRVLRTADPWREGSEGMVLQDVLDVAARRLDEDPPQSPHVMAQMRLVLGEVYRRIGRLDDAEAQLRKAEGTAELPPPTQREIDLALARTLMRRDELPEALELADAVVASLDAEHGPDHPETLKAQDVRGAVLRELGRTDEALALLLDTVERRKASLGLEHRETVDSLNTLATVYYTQGRFEESLEWFEQVLAFRERDLGPDHPLTITVVGNLGTSLARLQRYDEALPLLRRAVDSRRATLGDEHPSTLGALNNLGATLRRAGDLEGAEAMAHEAWMGRKRALGDAHVDTMESLSNYAGVLTEQKRYEDAEPVYEEGIRLAKERPESLARKLVTLSSNYGKLLRETERFDESEHYLKMASDEAHRLFGPEHWMSWAVQSNYANLLLARERHAEAEPLLVESYRKLRDLRGPENAFTARTYEHLEKLYEKTGAPEKLDALRVVPPSG